MANKTSSGQARQKTTSADLEKIEAAKIEVEKISEDIVKETSKQQQTLSPKDVDVSQYVTVRNGFQGRLIYKSSRTGERFIWDRFGSEQEMELRELRNARNSSKKFFINNWFMFDDDWVVDYLGVKQYYKNAVSIEDFDNIFSKPAGELKKIIQGMSAGQKRSAAYRARQLIADGEIDSNKSIAVLEEALGIELVER